MGSVENWFWKYNIDSMINELEIMAGEELDEGVRKVLSDDIKESDADISPPRWAYCQFDGRDTIDAAFAIDQGTDVCSIRLDLPDDLVCAAKTTVGMMQRYRIARR